MSDRERLEAMQRVVDAAREFHLESGPNWHALRYYDARQALRAALDALPAAPTQGETQGVRAAVWEHPDGDMLLLRPGSHTESAFRASPHTRYVYRCTALLPAIATEGGGE